MGLGPSLDVAVSLQKLAVMALAAALTLGLKRLTPHNLLRLCWALLALGLVASIAGNVLIDRNSWKLNALNRPVYDAFAHLSRFSDAAFSQNGLAALLILVIPFGVTLTLHSRMRPWAALATTLLLFELFLTESRAAMLSLGLALTLFVFWSKRPMRWLALAAPFLVVGVLASGRLTLPMTVGLLPTGGSSLERLAIWRSALLMMADLPLTGIGLGMFQRLYPLYILPAYYNHHPHAHNLFLQTYLDAGPLGCSGMLLLVGCVVAAILRLARNPPTEPAQRAIALGAAASSTAVLLHAQLDSYFAGDPRTYFFMFVPLGMLFALAGMPVLAISSRMRAAGALWLAGAAFLAVPLMWTSIGSLERLLAALASEAPDSRLHFELARGLEAAGNQPAALAEWRLAGAAPYLARQVDDERPLLLALQLDPAAPAAYEALGKLYLDQGRLDAAGAVLRARLGLPGDTAFARLLLARGYQLEGRPEDAAGQLRAAIPYSPENGALRQALAALVEPEYAGALQARARQVLATEPIGWYQLGLVEPVPARAIQDLERAVRAIPNQEDFRLALARAYSREGAASAAREQYLAVLGLDPGNTEARQATCLASCPA